MSGASERANGQASGPVLLSVFLAVFDHSALFNMTMAKIITWHPVQHLRPAETATIAPIKATKKNAFILSTCVTCATCAACAGKQSNDHERESFFLSLSEGTDRTSELRIGVRGSIQDLNTCPPQPYLKSNDFLLLRICFLRS